MSIAGHGHYSSLRFSKQTGPLNVMYLLIDGVLDRKISRYSSQIFLTGTPRPVGNICTLHLQKSDSLAFLRIPLRVLVPI